jgi:ubiquinone/menaquinone biosynthesis C-methylase UbiE
LNGALYDVGVSPLERFGLLRMRRRAWAAVPASGLGLEIGAGTGAAFPFHPPGARVVATDVSPGMLARARGKPGAAGTLLVVCDAQRLPFRDGTFDWAAETLAFCQVADPEAVLREIARASRPRAPLVMLEHVRPAGWLGRVTDLVSRVTVPLWGEHFDRSPDAPLARTGFRVDRRAWLWRDVFVLLECLGPGRRAT